MSGGEFAGKVAIVTGGGTGVGFAVARAFAGEGAHVAIAGRRQALLTHAAALIEENGGAGPDRPRGRGEPRRLRADRRRSGRAVRGGRHSGQQRRPFRARPPDRRGRGGGDAVSCYQRGGPLHCTRAFAKRAFERGRGGAIVNISSIAGARPAPGCGLYSASKAALDSLTRSMALEWAPKGLRVNAVAPGHVATEGVIEDFRTGRLDQAAMIKSIPAGRIADVDDITDAVLFLCGDRARHIMGQVLTVDGGEGF